MTLCVKVSNNLDRLRRGHEESACLGGEGRTQREERAASWKRKSSPLVLKRKGTFKTCGWSKVVLFP